MTISVSYFRSVVPEYAVTPPSDALIQVFIDIAEPYVNRRVWGSSKSDYIHALWTAHFMKLNPSSSGYSSTGVISEKKVGDLSYKMSNVAPVLIGETVYSSQIKNLMKTIYTGPIVLC